MPCPVLPGLAPCIYRGNGESNELLLIDVSSVSGQDGRFSPATSSEKPFEEARCSPMCGRSLMEMKSAVHMHVCMHTKRIAPRWEPLIDMPFVRPSS